MPEEEDFLGLSRFAQLTGANSRDLFSKQLVASVDLFVADCIRNQRSGQGDGLRAVGLTETADLLDM
ncbi:MAG: hypothetical protein ABR585_07940 [Gemmatimonadaceae bacterium]